VTKDFYLTKRGRFWYVRFRLPDGSIGTARSSGQTNKTAAEKWAASELPKVGSPRVSLGEWASPFYGPLCPHVSRLRIEGRPFSAAHQANCLYLLQSDILPDPICNKLLGDLSRSDILAFRDRLVARRALCRTSQRVMSVLRVIVREALFREYISRDLFAGIGIIQYQKKVRTALPLSELAPLFDPGNYSNPIHYQATVCAAFTGMRAGEVRALQWGDLDPAAGIITVQRSVPENGGESTLPKWGKTRTCPYPARLQRLLESRRGEPGSWVFSLRAEGPLGYKEWSAAVRRVGIPGLSLHRLRHTLNTVLRGDGIDAEILRGAFGWVDESTQDGYTTRAHYDYGPQGQAIDRLLGGFLETRSN